MRLLPCSACQRHVHIDDTVCPFCQTELGSRIAAPLPNTARMSRAARIALGAALAAMTLPGCGGSSQPKNPAPTAEPPDPGGPPDDGDVVAEYGAPAPPEPEPQPEPDPGAVAPEYGAPAPEK